MKKLVWEELFNGATLSILWKYYEPQPGIYRFEKNAPYMRFRPPPAFVLDEFKDLDLTYRAHCLTWFNKQWFFPEWVEKTAEDSAAASDIYIKKSLRTLWNRNSVLEYRQRVLYLLRFRRQKIYA